MSFPRRFLSAAALSLAALLAAPAALPAQDWAKARLDKSPRHLEWVTVQNGNRAVKCFVAFPERKDKAVAVVVIHEIFGLTDWVRGVCDQLAEAGYVAIAPDLLSGMGPGGGGTAEIGGADAVRGVIATLPPDQVTADLNAAADYVSKLPAANGKLAVGGFCWGGGQTFRYATTGRPDVKAAFVFYGNGPEQAAQLAQVKAPVLGFYGGNDARVNATVPKSSELAKEAGIKFDPMTYEGAGHGFMRTGEAPEAKEPDKKARDQAWARWKEALGKL